MTGPVRTSLITATGILAAVAIATGSPTMALAAEGPAPTIESESVANITQTDATLEAQIDPGSGEDGFALATEYEFFLESPWCGTYGPGYCEGSGGVLVSKGVIPAGSAPQRVSVDLAGAGHELTLSTTYGYRVVARNEAGTKYGGEQSFTTPPGGAPVIEGVSLLRPTATDATLGAQIDTEGLETKYEFLLWYSPCSRHGSGCKVLIDIPLPSGTLLGSFVPQDVSIDLNSAGVTLGEGEYSFSVEATNSAGGTRAGGGAFEVPGGPSAGPPPKPVPPTDTPPPGGGGSDQTQGVTPGWQTPAGASAQTGEPGGDGAPTDQPSFSSSATSDVSSYKSAGHRHKKHHGKRRHGKLRRTAKHRGAHTRRKP